MDLPIEKDKIPSPVEQFEVVETCRICGAHSFHLALEVETWRLMRCDDCGIVFTSPRYTSEGLASLYASEYYERAADYFASQSAPPSEDHIRIARQAARYVRASRPTAIDIGTGCGRQVSAFSAIGFRAKGTEPNDLACTVAQKNGRDVVNVAIEALPSASYDCVVALHVLEHVPEPLRFVEHMARIAVPGGIVMIEVPNFASAASRRLGARWRPLYPNTHLFHFTPDTLANVCQRAGLAVLATHRVGGAGLCGGLAHANPNQASLSTKKSSSPQTRPGNSKLKRMIWDMRKPILRIPGLRPFLRWVNWEVLGYGEYVRIIARKAA